MIFYSTEARPFMLMMFLVLLSTLALLRAWTPVAQPGGSPMRYDMWRLLIPLHRNVPRRGAIGLGLLDPAPGSLGAGGGQRRRRGGLHPVGQRVSRRTHALNFISALAPVNFHVLETILETSWIGHPETTIDRVPGSWPLMGAAGLSWQWSGWSWAQGNRPRAVAMSGRNRTDRAAGGRPGRWLRVQLARTNIFGGPFLIASWPGLALLSGSS